jgi:protein gp37
VPVPFIRKVWGTMAAAHWHVFQVPRKRPERMREIASEHRLPVLANVWLGVSVESAAYKDRIEVLRRTPARVRFVRRRACVSSRSSRCSRRSGA